jgi:uncharacterized protein YndB with AHSA1/START domain
VSQIRIVRDYPYPPARVWRAVTDPALIPLWTATGAGGRPEGFAPVAGTLADLSDDGTLRAASTLRPRSLG